jgi:uncharacterized protein YbaA (DUF1428 family)
MAHYVDGFIVPVPENNLKTYLRIAQKAGKIWREHGALEFIECVADDVKPGKLTSFPQSVKLNPTRSSYSHRSYSNRARIAIGSTKDHERPAYG